MPKQVYRVRMTLHDLQNALEANPKRFPRFVLPNGDYIPAHAHVTEVGLVVRSFIDCGGLTGKEEKILLQAHVGDDTDHRAWHRALCKDPAARKSRDSECR